eukprot:scaffold1906_cov34-Tisochrysis_lutea.AAC.3
MRTRSRAYLLNFSTSRPLSREHKLVRMMCPSSYPSLANVSNVRAAPTLPGGHQESGNPSLQPGGAENFQQGCGTNDGSVRRWRGGSQMVGQVRRQL